MRASLPSRLRLAQSLGMDRERSMQRHEHRLPYRRTQAYARAVVAAALQRAAVHHRTGELTTHGGRLTTSAALRRQWFGGPVRR